MFILGLFTSLFFSVLNLFWLKPWKFCNIVPKLSQLSKLFLSEIAAFNRLVVTTQYCYLTITFLYFTVPMAAAFQQLVHQVQHNTERI